LAGDGEAARVDQVKIGPGNIGLDLAVDRRRIAASHLADRGRPNERGAFAGCQTELPKALEEVAADLLAEIGTIE
jgi:hypothetical protein